MRRFLLFFERFDWTLCIACLALTAIGMAAIYGIGMSQQPASLFTFYKQGAAGFIGLLILTALVFIDYRHLRSLGLPLYGAGAILLLLVLFFGETVHGTRGWFRIGGISFQPVEIAKITLTIYLAALFTRLSHGRLSWRALGLSGCAAGLYAFLVLLQPDFGSAMVMLGTWAILALFKGLPRRSWIIFPIVCLAIGALLWTIGLKPYQRERIVSFLHPTSDMRGANYNAIQARIAIGSGGWFGKGIGEGSQARLQFLPEAATDFMFAVIGEELGFAGVTLILGLFCLILYRLSKLAYESHDPFAGLMLIGLSAILFTHVIVNAGMNLGVMPITGIPLPFVSAAASYLAVTYIGIGCAESVAVRRNTLVHE